MQYRLKDAEQRVSSACTTQPQPVLHTLSLYCTYFIQGEKKQLKTFPDFELKDLLISSAPVQFCKNNTIVPQFSAPARFSAPHKTSNFDKCPCSS